MTTSRRDIPAELSEVSVVRLTDPTTVAESIEVLNQDVVNLDPDAFAVTRVTVPLDNCCLVHHRSSVAVRTLTRVHADFDACTIIGPDSRGSMDGIELSPFSLMVAAPGGVAELIVDRNYESISWLVPPRELAKHLSLRRRKSNFEVPNKPAVWHPESKMAQDLFELGKRISVSAEENPEIFNENHWARYGAQVEFMDSLFATIESYDVDEDAEAGRKGRSYSQIVKACETYTLELEGQRPYVSELCEVAGVSERTLQYAFRDIMGMSPLTFLHRLRLHRARDELRRSENSSTKVTDVAMNWGFWHFGEFSRAYKNCFGEVPSKTLRQPPTEN